MIRNRAHNIHIILLELLDNTLNLQLVEIEGDALLCSVQIPNYEELLQQTKQCWKFHKHTKYDTKRICNCGSCQTTIDLDLNFSSMLGELTMIK
jgi:hypothetical protein